MSKPTLFVVGATHQKAPIEVRERLALGSEAEAALQAELTALAGLRELTVLNTCNRIEFYGLADSAEAISGVEAGFCARQHFDSGEFERFRMRLVGSEAVRHLFEVAAGMDSQMLGETEIFGQVKEAYATAQTRKSVGPALNKVFQKAFHAAKHVRSNTAITSGPISVANVAVELAQSIFGELKEARILLLGAGEIGEKTAKAFRSRGAAAVTVSSRSSERAMQLATELGASALPFDQREARLSEFDVVACATSAPTTVLSAAAIAAAAKRRPARPLLLIDLAMPRDVDPEAASLDNVFVYNLDDLAKVAEENRSAREAEASRCRSLLAERAETVWRDIEARLGLTQLPVQPVPGSSASGLSQ